MGGRGKKQEARRKKKEARRKRLAYKKLNAI